MDSKYASSKLGFYLYITILVLELWTNVYDYATIIIPSLLTAPRYFAGEVEFGVIAQATYAFNQISSALSTFVLQFEVNIETPVFTIGIPCRPSVVYQLRSNV